MEKTIYFPTAICRFDDGKDRAFPKISPGKNAAQMGQRMAHGSLLRYLSMATAPRRLTAARRVNLTQATEMPIDRQPENGTSETKRTKGAKR